MLYFKYRKFIKIFKSIQQERNVDDFDWKLEEMYGALGKEAVSILRAKGGLTEYGLFHKGKDVASIDTLILEYEDRCSSMFWGFMKWTIGTLIAIAGLIITYLTFLK